MAEAGLIQRGLDALAAVDPSPLFALSLLPYLAFLWWARQVRGFPPLALKGFVLTLLFVAVTIAAALIAQLQLGRQLADVDPLHGGAEAFLTLSNLVVAAGFVLASQASEPKR
ncbi:MAG: DUF3593 domain-containing protein [Cyanobacteria bacterium K_DeepCast_35m_m2_023]|nr:DUF3593 domain-containing protein [Cyanobacteria bacterium K_DeepCast_35m_m2_023]